MKLYGADGDQSGVDFVTLDDGDFLLLGNTQSGISVNRIYLVRVNALGEVVWEKKMGSSADVARDIEPTPDGNFVILSNVTQTANNTDIKLIRIRPDGSKIDSVVYGFPENDNAQTVTPVSDGGFIITGSTLHGEAENTFSNIFHFRCNANLVFDKITWKESNGATGQYDAATKVIEKGDGEFYVFGYSNRDHPGNQTGKLNLSYYSVGSEAEIKIRDAYIGDFDEDTRAAFAMEVPEKMGGGYFIMGTKTSSTGVSTMQVGRLRVPLNFNSTDILLDESIDSQGKVMEAVAAAPAIVDGEGFLLLGNEIRLQGSNIWLTRINQSAVVEWSVSIGSEGENDTAAAIKELDDGRILVLGTVGLADNQTKMALFKLNSSGHLQD